MPELLIPPLLWVDLGLCEYQQAWDLQKRMHALCVAGRLRGVVLMVQHPSVLTLGKNADASFIKSSQAALRQQQVTVISIDRGGEVTAHNPGQLVVYPILPLREFRLTPKKFVALLEELVIQVLRSYGVKGGRDEINPGVWVGRDKICAIGVRIQARVSLHGFAFNISNDLNLFNNIVPCGIVDRGVTSLSHLLGRMISCGEVVPYVVDFFKNNLDKELVKASIIPSSDGERWQLQAPNGLDMEF